MFLGLDLGTSAVKALLADADGNVVASRSAPLTVERPHHGWSEQDPESWWRATQKSVAELKRENPSLRVFCRPCLIRLRKWKGHEPVEGASLSRSGSAVLRSGALWSQKMATEGISFFSDRVV